MKAQWLAQGVLTAAFVALALAACSRREDPPVDPNPFPTDYKAEIIAFMPKVVSNPSNIRNASISDPAFMQVGEQPRFFACVRFTPKRTDTEYGAPEERIAMFFAGHLSQFVPATREQCGNVAYRPFPELEQICFKSKGCK